MRRLAIVFTAIGFLSSLSVGFLSEPAIGGHGISFDPTVIPGVEASVWYGPDARCMDFTYCTFVLQPWMIR